MADPSSMIVMADVYPDSKGDTLPLCLSPLMESVGRPEWTVEMVEGIMGHAFHFEMEEGGGFCQKSPANIRATPPNGMSGRPQRRRN